MVFTGAGISTESGIPDFRSPGGVWEQFDPLEFHISRFLSEPTGFWEKRMRLIAAMDYLAAEPNEAHHVIAEATRAGRVHSVVTQNVDGLHGKAGTPPDRLIEIHGNGANCICMSCRRRTATEEVVEAYQGQAPRCACGGILKPDVVLFGEPVNAVGRAIQAVEAAERLIVVGTSLQVYPAAGLVDVAISHGAQVHIVNRESTPYDRVATALYRGPLGPELRALLSN